MKSSKPGINGTLRGPVVIAVEGRDYFYAIRKYFEDAGKFPEEVQLWDFKENGLKFSQGMEVLIGLSAFRRGRVKCLGIIADAEDVGRKATESSIHGCLAAHKLPIPTKQMEIATAPKNPATAYLIMPHDKEVGCLDTALLEASIAPSEHMKLVEEFVAKISAIQPSVNDNVMDKRRVRALISGSGEKPYRTVSHCVGSLWSFKHPSLKVMLELIELMRAAVPHK